MGASALALTAGVQPASEAVEAVSKVLTGDLIVIRGRLYRERTIETHGPDRTPKGKLRKHTITIEEPVDYEFHVNPVTIGLGALTVGAGLVGLALAAWWAGVGVKLDPRAQNSIDGLKSTIRDREALIRLREAHLISDHGSLAAVPPDHPFLVEIANAKALIKEARKEIRKERRNLFRLDLRGRFSPDFSLL